MSDSLDTIVARCKLCVAVVFDEDWGPDGGFTIHHGGKCVGTAWYPDAASHRYFDFCADLLSAGPDVSPTLPPPGSAGKAAGLSGSPASLEPR